MRDVVRSAQPLANGRFELFWIEGLAEKIRHPRGHALLLIALEGIRRQGNDRNARRLRAHLAFADGAGRLEAVHDGHLAIHEHDIEGLARDGVDGLATISDAFDHAAHTFQEIARDLLIDETVFDEQHFVAPSCDRIDHDAHIRRCLAGSAILVERIPRHELRGSIRRVAHHGLDGVAQLIVANFAVEIGLRTSVHVFGRVFIGAVCGHRDDRQSGRRRNTAQIGDFAQKGFTGLHAFHDDEEHTVRFGKTVDCRFIDRAHNRPDITTEPLQHTAHGRGLGVVFRDHENAAPLEAEALRDVVEGDRLLVDVQRQRKPEHRTEAYRALHTDAAAHALDQRFADRQPQSGAFVAARGRIVNLTELLENVVDLVGRNADAGIAHFEPKADFAIDIVPAQRHGHTTFVGEFRRIADDICQNLPDATDIAQIEMGQVGLDDQMQLDVFCRARRREQRDHIADAHHQIERRVAQFDLARLDFGKIENVVDDREQRATAAQDRADISLLLAF